MGNLKKNADGYGYKYTDLAEINTALEKMGITYWQYIERIEGEDYIFTVPVIDGKQEPPRQGCKVIIPPFDRKSNPAQEQGSGITYARRYSLLMAFGFATEDDDAGCITRDKKTSTEEVNEVPGYPSRQIMLEVIKKHYPEGSEYMNRLLKSAEGSPKSIDEFTDAQVIAVYNRIGGR